MRVLPTVTLTDNQKRVIAKTLASPTPRVAAETLSGDRNLITARDQLAALGAVQFVGNELSVTEKGQELARDENIIDDSGQLTQDGNALAYDEEKQPGGEQDPNINPNDAINPEQQSLNMSHTPKRAGLSLLQDIIKTARDNERSKWLADDHTNKDRPVNATPDISSFKNFLKS